MQAGAVLDANDEKSIDADTTENQYWLVGRGWIVWSGTWPIYLCWLVSITISVQVVAQWATVYALYSDAIARRYKTREFSSWVGPSRLYIYTNRLRFRSAHTVHTRFLTTSSVIIYSMKWLFRWAIIVFPYSAQTLYFELATAQSSWGAGQERTFLGWTICTSSTNSSLSPMAWLWLWLQAVPCIAPAADALPCHWRTF